MYVAGFTNGGVSGGLYKIAKYWKNGATVNLTNGLMYDAEATSITTIGADIYVAGIEKNAAGNTIAKYWKNGIPVNFTDGSKVAISTFVVIGN